jgi:hypothetical protein
MGNQKLSPTMQAALRAIAGGEVIYDGLWCMTSGPIRSRCTLDALEHRGLARIDYDHPTPESASRAKAWLRAWPVVLTEAGEAALGA